MSVQRSLNVFDESGWDLVKEYVFEGSSGPVCPDCQQITENGYWPVAEDGVDGVHGVGCERCQTVVPHPAPSNLFDKTNEIVTLELRSGEKREVAVAKTTDHKAGRKSEQ